MMRNKLLWHYRTSKMSGIESTLYFCKGVRVGLIIDPFLDLGIPGNYPFPILAEG